MKNLKKISTLDIVLFFQQLATLIKANIPLLQSCHLLLQSQKNIAFQLIIHSLKNEIEAGRGLANGLKKFPHLFNSVVCHLVQVGETTGTLEKILNLIVGLLEKSLRIRNQIKQALFYPITVLLISLVVCLMMLIFIVPRFSEFFQSFHGQLPLYTRCIIKLSEIIRTRYEFLLFPVILGWLGFKYYQRSSSFRKNVCALPFFTPFLTKIFILHFARNLSIVYSAGINIAEGLQLISQVHHHPEHAHTIRKIKNKVLSGQQLYLGMRSCTLFPPLVIQMVRIGEESGALQSMLETVANLYETDIDRLVIRMNQLLEPLIMIILGALIGGLIIAMYLPIFKLGTMI